MIIPMRSACSGAWPGETMRPMPPDAAHTPLTDFLHRHQRIFVLTGAGCSTESGIPAYRDPSGEWARKQPVTWQAFSGDPHMRKRYWARSMVGWRSFGVAIPNGAHRALAVLERSGKLSGLVTQNVDRLHQDAGHRDVIDLHGRLDTVICLGCGMRLMRSRHQQTLESANPQWLAHAAAVAPDGDADLESGQFDLFAVPDCHRCGGMLKPDVVFFGESVPRERVDASMRRLQTSDAMLVVGSSLMVYSGFRYARTAAELGLPIAAINMGRTRADVLLRFKVERPCASALSDALAALAIADPSLNPGAEPSRTSPA